MGEEPVRDAFVVDAGGVAITSDMNAPSRTRNFDRCIGEHTGDNCPRHESDGTDALRYC